MGETECFFGLNIARGSGGDDGMNPKPNKKLSLGAESYGTIAWKGFFTQSQVLLSSIELLSQLENVLLTVLYFRLLNFLRPQLFEYGHWSSNSSSI